MVGIYCVFMFYILLQQSSRKKLEVIPIAFLGIAFASGLVLPFVYGKDYAQIFCTTIAIALYVYYEFSILTLTKRDALTGLLNRQAYYSNTENNPENITALISIDVNGLKAINDNGGHAAGDEALVTLARCFMDALHSGKQRCYRTGGDEFVVVCHQTPESETVALVERIKQNVAATPYHCAIGYSCAEEGTASADDLLKRSDDMMYADKTRYYEESGAARRQA
jgi:diguanylate cyclase (GGDEF)-like protein